MTYHCASRSDRQDLHTITVENMTVLCSCVGTEWCSHIDATLKHGERHMVPFEEWDIADEAQILKANILRLTPNWKANWLEDKVWRGVGKTRKTEIAAAIADGRPRICCIGEGELGTCFDSAHKTSHHRTE